MGGFPNEGPFPQTLQETWAKIFSEWLPSSGYQVVAAPEISFTQYQGPAEAKYSEIWLAVTATKENPPLKNGGFSAKKEKVWYNKREEKIRPSKLKSSYG